MPGSLLSYCRFSFRNELFSSGACGCSETTTALQDFVKNISSRAWFKSYQDTLSSCNISKNFKSCGLTIFSVDFPFIQLHSLKLGMKAVESERTDHLIISFSVVSIDCVCVRATSSFYQSVSTKSLCNECCSQDGRWQRPLSEQTLFFNQIKI